MSLHDQTFKVALPKGKRLGPEYNPWWWNPNRGSVAFAPTWFMEKLREVGPELSCTWNPIKERWQIWAEKPRMQNPICSGWVLLFVVQNEDGSYRPLDERVFARLYEASAMKWGNGKAYFEAIVREKERERERREKNRLQEQIDMAMPFWEHSQIKNIGKGNKFTRYHA
jgi:hypothetical protein